MGVQWRGREGCYGCKEGNLGYNNFLIDTSMQAYISIYLPLLGIVQGFFLKPSPSKYHTKDWLVCERASDFEYFTLQRFSFCHPQVRLAGKTQFPDFFGVWCSLGSDITGPGSLSLATFSHFSFLCRFPSPFLVFLSFDSISFFLSLSEILCWFSYAQLNFDSITINLKSYLLKQQRSIKKSYFGDKTNSLSEHLRIPISEQCAYKKGSVCICMCLCVCVSFLHIY